MTSKFLSIYQRNATRDIARRMPLFLKTPADRERALDICQAYRQRGIFSLFETGVPDDLVRDLHYSARVYAFHLGAVPDERRIASHSVPFFDALASRDLRAAESIARLGRNRWTDGEEFEDDYCYFRFLWGKFFLRTPPEELEEVLGRYEKILDGNYDPRFAICRAIADNDATAFDAALIDFLLAHEARYKTLGEQDSILPEEAVSEGKLCVEGLALVNAVEPLGLSSKQDYLFIPSTAREAVSMNYETERWRAPAGAA